MDGKGGIHIMCSDEERNIFGTELLSLFSGVSTCEHKSLFWKRWYLMLLSPACLLILFLFAACDAQLGLIERHVSDRELQIRAGYFDTNGIYMGGAPEVGSVKRFDDNDCQQTASGNKTYCSYWRITQNGGGSSSDGNCKCTRGNAPNNTYCLSYFCDQTVTTTTTCGDETYPNTCTTTFGKYKLCQCYKADTMGRFCERWQCLGYNDGPIKTANWFCKTLASAAIGTPPSQDYCYTFGSDQYSSEVQEAKDCTCTQDGGSYCAHWICDDRIYKNWPWWTPIVGSLVGALLNLWTPFEAKRNNDCCCTVVQLIWTLVTYVEIVLVGGVPSAIANTGALLIAWLIAFHEHITCCYCYCATRPASRSANEKIPEDLTPDGHPDY